MEEKIYKGWEILKAIDYKQVKPGSIIVDIQDSTSYEYIDDDLFNYEYWLIAKKLINNTFKIVEPKEKL